MKKLGMIILVVGIFALVYVLSTKWVGRYTREGVVRANYLGKCIIVDTHGDYWEICDNGLQIGDTVSMKIYDNGTEKYIHDDVIESITVVNRN